MEANLGCELADRHDLDAIAAILWRMLGDAMLAEGSALAHYVVLEPIGEGGMGIVYKARDIRLRRLVALKVLSPSLFDAERRLRFLREAQTASGLEHPNIVRIYDVGTAEGRDYIAMQWVAGQTLDLLIPNRGLAIDIAIHYALQIADALAYAHGASIIHRDLKPRNVIINAQGHTTLVDFGLAKCMREHDEVDVQTQTGTVVGTIAYMSPEQARGEELDERSDVFALGVILFEMLTGKRPFSGPTPAGTYDAVLNSSPVSLHSLREEVPPALEDIVLKALEKDRQRRYQSAAELRDDLKRLIMEFSPGSALSTSSTVTLLMQGRARKPWKFVIPAMLALCILAVVWVGTIRQRRTPPVPWQPRPVTTFPGGEYEPAFSPDGRMIAFVWGGEHDENFDIYVQAIDVGPPRRLTSNPDGEGSPAWSPDGRYVAFLRYSGSATPSGVYLIPAAGGTERKIADLSGVPHIFDRHLDWSPDGNWLAVVDRNSPEGPFCIHLLSLIDGVSRQLTAPRAGTIGDTGPAFSPDGRQVAFRRTENVGTNDLYVVATSGGEPRRLTFDRRFTSGHAWAQGGHEIILASQRTGPMTLWRIDTSGGAPQMIPGGAEGVYNVAIARTGNRLAYSKYSVDTNVWETDLTSGVKRRVLDSTRNERSAQYSPDGTRIAFRSDRSGADEVWVCDASGRDAIQLTSFNGPLTGTPRWSPSGRFVAFDSRPNGNADIYVVGANGEPVRRVTSANAEDVVPSWSRDGKWLYFASNRGGDWQVWKIASDTVAEASSPLQVTRNGGFAAFESADGPNVLYAKGRNAPGIWMVPAVGGEERLLIESLRAGYWGNWAVADSGVFFVRPIPPEAAAVDVYQFSNRRTRTVAVLTKDPPFSDSGFAVSRDGHKLLYSQVDHSGSDIYLVEYFQ